MKEKWGWNYGERLLENDKKNCKEDKREENKVKDWKNEWELKCKNKRWIKKDWVCDGDDEWIDK